MCWREVAGKGGEGEGERRGRRVIHIYRHSTPLLTLFLSLKKKRKGKQVGKRGARGKMESGRWEEEILRVRNCLNARELRERTEKRMRGEGEKKENGARRKGRT